MLSARYVIVIVMAALIWGFHFVVVKVGLQIMSPIFYAAMRMTLVAVLLSPFLRWRPGSMGPVLAMGFCLGAANYALLNTSLVYAPATVTAMTVQLVAPIATLLSVVFLGDRLGWRRILGIGLAFAGVTIISAGAGIEKKPGDIIVLGVVFGLGAVFAEAVGAINVKRAASSFQPIELLAWAGLVGALTLWPLSLMFERGQFEAFLQGDTRTAIGAVLFSAILASIVAHSSYYWLLHRLPVAIASTSAMLTPLFAVFFAVLLLGEPFTPLIALGAGMTISGVAIVLLRNAKKQTIDQDREAAAE
ncbi:MAG: DMT family transporter [Pseudomonadota bacterium]